MAERHLSGRHQMHMPTRDDVARRAYELFQARGSEPGHDLDHWLEAERELSHSFTGGEPSREPRGDRRR